MPARLLERDRAAANKPWNQARYVHHPRAFDKGIAG